MENKFCKKASVVLGGVSAAMARRSNRGIIEYKILTADIIKKAAEAAIDKALSMKQNTYKIQLTKVIMKRVLGKLA